MFPRRRRPPSPSPPAPPWSHSTNAVGLRLHRFLPQSPSASAASLAACARRLTDWAPVARERRKRGESRLWHPFADMALVKDSELVIERGERVWVWDDAGNRYLDATASLWYANVGHGRAEIAEAIAAQLKRLEAYSIFGDLATRPALA